MSTLIVNLSSAEALVRFADAHKILNLIASGNLTGDAAKGAAVALTTLWRDRDNQLCGDPDRAPAMVYAIDGRD